MNDREEARAHFYIVFSFSLSEAVLKKIRENTQ